MALPPIPLTQQVIDPQTGLMDTGWSRWLGLLAQTAGGGSSGSVDPNTVILPEVNGAVIVGQAGAWSALAPGPEGDQLTIVGGSPAWAADAVSASLTVIAASSYASGNQTFTSGVAKILSFDTLSYDQGGCYNAFSPTLLTVPSGQGGIYLVRGQFKLGTGFAGVASLSILQNGVAVGSTSWQGSDVTSGSESHTAEIFVNAASKDALSLSLTLTLAVGGTYVVSGGSAATLFQIARVAPSSGAADLASVVPVTARVYASANQAISAGVETAVSFDTVDFDTKSLYSAGSPTVLTVPSDGGGYYLAQGQIQFPSGYVQATSGIFLSLTRNGTAVAYEGSVNHGPQNSGTSERHHVSGVVKLAAGDQIALHVQGSNGFTAEGGIAATWLALAKLANFAPGTGSSTLRPTIVGANVTTTETQSASAAYGDLATVGPSVTVTLPGTSAIVWMSAVAFKTTSFNTAWISVAVSGATTLAANDANGTEGSNESSAVPRNTCLSRVLLLTGLTSGSNTFTLQYRNDGGAWSFLNRSIAVYPI